MASKQERFELFRQHCTMHLSTAETADVKAALGDFIKEPSPRELVRRLNGVLNTPAKVKNRIHCEFYARSKQ